VTTQNAFAATAVVAVLAYYLLAWFVFGWGRKIGTVLPQLEMEKAFVR